MKSKNISYHFCLVLAVPKISVLTILSLKNVDLPRYSHFNCPLQFQQKQKGHLHRKKNNTKHLKKRRQFKMMILRWFFSWKYSLSKDSKNYNAKDIIFFRKVKLKIKKNDDPVEVSANFAKIYGLNQRSQNALISII